MVEEEFEVIREAVMRSVDGVAQTGFEIDNLWSLVTGTRYRLDTLFWDRVHELEEESGFDLSSREMDKLSQAMGASYDRFAPTNLAETLRYQYDRTPGEKDLKRRPFPEVGSDAYNQIYTEMATMGPLLRKLIELREGLDPFSFLPYKNNGVWYKSYSDIPDDQRY